MVDVAPAATVRLTLGGTGRPVVGKAVSPPSSPAATIGSTASAT